MSPLLSCHDLSIAIPGRTLVETLSLQAGAGEVLAVLGQNGSGKTLTMHTLAGLRPAAAGRVLLGGDDVAICRRQDIARRLALLPQHVDDIFPATVLDTAMIGRHPHIGRFEWEGTDAAARRLPARRTDQSPRSAAPTRHTAAVS